MNFPKKTDQTTLISNYLVLVVSDILVFKSIQITKLDSLSSKTVIRLQRLTVKFRSIIN